MKAFLPQTVLSLSLVLFACFGLAGCATNTGTITRAAVAHISFVGNTQDAHATIDDQAPVLLDGGKLPTQPGKHRIRVTRSGRLVVDREVLVGDQQTMEISVP